jgi:hypothetical protein
MSLNVKKNQKLMPGHYAKEIEAVIEEFLDWKDVYASTIPEGKIGVVVFAVSEFNDVYVEWRFEKNTARKGAKTTFDDGSTNGLTAQIVWADQVS